MLLAEGQGVKTSSLDFAVDFLEAVRERHFPVVWALRSNLEPDGAATPVVAILRSLISQVLELDATGMARSSADVMTLTNFKNVTTAQQWLDLLERCIFAVPRLFVVVDMATIGDTDDDRMEDCFSAHGFLEHLSAMVDRRRGAGLKVMAISGGMDATAASARDSTTVDTSSDDMRIATDMGRMVQRLMKQPKYRAFYKKRQQHSGQEFQSAFGQQHGK